RVTAPRVRAHQYDDLILVTSSYQMKRALLDFERVGFAPQPVYANRRDARLGWLPRAANLANAELALHEIVGVAQFHVYRR
ncbi:ElyC/SanA/YdcF family protein, partial [Burkholderia pseudomallei]